MFFKNYIDHFVNIVNFVIRFIIYDFNDRILINNILEKLKQIYRGYHDNVVVIFVDFISNLNCRLRYLFAEMFSSGCLPSKQRPTSSGGLIDFSSSNLVRPMTLHSANVRR